MAQVIKHMWLDGVAIDANGLLNGNCDGGKTFGADEDDVLLTLVPLTLTVSVDEDCCVGAANALLPRR
jgi:hypothetical protein